MRRSLRRAAPAALLCCALAGCTEDLTAPAPADGTRRESVRCVEHVIRSVAVPQAIAGTEFPDEVVHLDEAGRSCEAPPADE